MKAVDIQTYFRTLNGGWLDPYKTVDTFKAGNPDTEITAIAVSWMSTLKALKKALKLGCNLFITHEPTFYTHLENDNQIFRFEGAKDKRSFIERNKLIILRCHDLWDQIKDIGIPDTWADQLGFMNPIAGEGYFRVYDVSGKTAIEIVHQVAKHTRVFGQEGIEFIGSEEKQIYRVAIGTGAITPFLTLIEKYQADMVICTDDGMNYWSDGAFASDTGIPLIVVNHAVSEEAGMISLAKHLASKFPEIPVHHIPQGCMYRILS